MHVVGIKQVTDCKNAWCGKLKKKCSHSSMKECRKIINSSLQNLSCVKEVDFYENVSLSSFY